MNNRLYEILKWCVAIVLPAATTFYATLADSWGWDNTEAITACLAALTLFLGILIKTFPTYDGTAYVEENADLDSPNKFNLHLNGDPADLENQKTVRLKVKPRRTV